MKTSNVSILADEFSINWGNLPDSLRQKIKSLEYALNPFLNTYKISNSYDSPLIVEASIHEIQCEYNLIPPAQTPSQLFAYYHFPIKPNVTKKGDVAWGSLSSSQKLVVSNLSLWVKKRKRGNMS